MTHHLQDRARRGRARSRPRPWLRAGTTTSPPAVPVLRLTGGDQGVICAGVNAMAFMGTSDPFGTEASATTGKFQVGTAEAANAVASAIRAPLPEADLRHTSRPLNQPMPPAPARGPTSGQDIR
jgi:hypothetical protein